MKKMTRLLSLLLVLVMLLPMVVACSDPTVENDPAQDKTPEAGETATLPEEQEKTDAKALLLELLRNAELDANSAKITAKFKGDINVSFLDPELSYNTDDLVDYVDENGFITLPVEDILAMLEDSSSIGKLVSGAVKDLLLDFVGNGGYADLDSMLESIYSELEIDLEQIKAMENPDAYVAAVLLPQFIGAALKLSEQKAHEAVEDYEGLEYCIEQIDAMALMATDYIIGSINELTDFADLIDIICDTELLALIEGESVCGIERPRDNDSLTDLGYVLEEIAYDIEKYEERYIGNGNYNLEVLYPAISDNLFDLAYVFGYRPMSAFPPKMLSYGEPEEDKALEALDAYLGSENGPIANLDPAKIFLAIASLTFASDLTEQLAFACDYHSDTTMVFEAYFNLADEKWYGFDGHVFYPIEEELAVFYSWGEYAYYYYGEFGFTDNYREAYENAGTVKDVYAVYYVYDKDADILQYNDFHATVQEAIAIIFNALIEGVEAEITEENEMIVGTAALIFMGEYFEGGFSSVSEYTYSLPFILTVLSDTVANGLPEALAQVIRLYGVDDEEEIDNYISAVVIDTEIEGVTYETPFDYIMGATIKLLASENVSESLDSWFEVDFSLVTAVYLYERFFAENRELYPEDEDLSDGLPLVTVIAALSEYAYLRSEDYDYYDVIEILNEYFEGKEPYEIVNYEDILALFIAVNDTALNFLDEFEYPFDLIRYNVANQAIHGFVDDKYSEANVDPEEIMYAHQIADALILKIFTIDHEYDAIQLATRFMMIALYPTLETPGVFEITDAIENVCYKTLDTMELTPLDLTISEAYTQFVIPAMLGMFDGERYLEDMLNILGVVEDPDTLDSIVDAIEVLYLGSGDISEGDPAAWAYLLVSVSGILESNGIVLPQLDNMIEALEDAGEDFDMEDLLDTAFTEFLGGEDYTVLTDVVLSLKAGDIQTVIETVDAAIAALDGDAKVVGYLKALKAAITGATPETDGMLNAFAVLYFKDLASVIPALFMSADEFNGAFEDANVLALRAWAAKYYASYTEQVSINLIEACVDFLVAVGYYNEEDIPEATDPDYYGKLATIYAAQTYFGDEEYAAAIVAAIYAPDTVSIYADTYLEMADMVEPATQQHAIFKLALYLLSTKAYLGVEDETEVDWETALAYIPETYYSLTQEELVIGNYAALVDMLRPAFEETLNLAFNAEVVPYETATEVVYVFTVYGDLYHVALEGACELVIEIRVPKA